MGIVNYFKRILITINYELILENEELKKKNRELENTIKSLKQKEKPKVKELLKLIERKNKIIKNIREENKKLNLKRRRK